MVGAYILLIEEPIDGRRIHRQRGNNTADGLEFRGEYKSDTVEEVIQRLDAEAVARQKERAVLPVVNAEGPHAVELLDTGRSPKMVAVQHDFGVCAGLKPVPVCFEFTTKRPEVVNLAIVGDDQVLEAHRLAAAG